MKYNYEIYTQINKYKGKDKNRMHMPGHKNVGEFRALFPVASIDFTELPFSDNLGCPSGAIKKAQADIAEILGAKRSFITTDGSSSGVMAIMYAASKSGNKIIVPRNSHKSVFNACRLLGLEPVIVQGAEYEGVLLPPDGELIERLIVNDVNISGMIIASPDYYGNIAPLEEYSKILKKHGRLLLVDGAHGAHLALEEKREGYAGVFADAWVDGVHKTMPTLTQGAVINVGNEALIEDVKEGVDIFRTTSPSYPIMASVEYGVKYYVNNPKVAEKAKAALTEFKEQLSAFSFYPSNDWTKVALDLKAMGISPEIVEEQLVKRGIYTEMNDGRYVLLYLSPSVEPVQLNEVKNVLLWLAAQKKFKNTYKDKNKPIPASDRTYSYLYALKQRSELVPLKESAGRMCAENAGLVPPCFPTVIAGEMISQAAISYLLSGGDTFGIYGGKIRVVKK